MKASLAALLLFALAAWPCAAHAQRQIDECFAPVVEQLSSRGAHPEQELVRGFLLEGESAMHVEDVGARDQCVGFLVLGGKSVRDVDLALYTATGTALVEDVGTDAHPYVRFCGASGLSLRVVVRMYQGQGEYRILRIDDAPTSIDRLDALLGRCAGPASAGAAEAYPDIGPEPAPASLEQRTEQALARWRGKGYIPTERAQSGQVAQGRTAQHRIDLGAGDCYALLALGDAGILDLDLAVFAMSHGRAMRDGSRDRDASVRFCAEEAHHMVEVRAYRGQGSYRLMVLRLVEDPSLRAERLQGAARVLASEWAYRAQSRGLRARAERWVSIAPASPIELPMRLRAGACYAIGGVPGPELERGDLDIVVTDPSGNLLTWDTGPDNAPMAFRCPVHDEDVRIQMRLAAAARSRALLLIASDEGTP